MNQAFYYTLRMFGIRLIGPASVYFDNKEIYKNVSIIDSVLNKNHYSVLYHACREAVSSEMIIVENEDTMTNVSDLFTKIITKVVRERFFHVFMY